MQKKDILFFILATILFIICCFIAINSYPQQLIEL